MDPMLEILLEGADDGVDADTLGDVHGLMKSLGAWVQFGVPFQPLSTPAGLSYDLPGDRVAKADDDWNTPIAENEKAATASAMPEFQKNVINRLERFGISEEEAQDLLS